MVAKVENHINRFESKLFDVLDRIDPAIKEGKHLEAIALENLFISGFITAMIQVHVLEDRLEDRGGEFNKLPEKVRNVLLNLNHYSEKEMFRWGLILDIVTENSYKDLKEFYNKRNNAFHRFLTSKGTYDDLKSVAEEGHKLIKNILAEGKDWMDRTA